MTSGSRNMLIGSMAVAGLVALMTVLDMAMGMPFGGQKVLDIMFLLSAGLIGYMCFDTYKEMS